MGKADLIPFLDIKNPTICFREIYFFKKEALYKGRGALGNMTNKKILIT